ncbi:MAG: glycoside hydrolase family 3 C-terminal domain-containing protein, partial [Pseudomonadota bacterium]|nr:glycoside hydrolase family 3 C-terminal domain-containing protein [Pseudomonadota bacterium]
MDVGIGRDAARESDLLAFEIALEEGEPGAVMCAYNKVNGENACASEWLLTDVLRETWGYPGFVMSDWGAVPSLQAAMAGLDQQSAASLDKEVYFENQLLARANADPRWDAQLDAMNERILTAVYRFGLDRDPAEPGGAIDYEANAEASKDVATAGMVLLRNEGGILPLAEAPRRILVVGGYADAGVLSGAGSSQAHGEGGAAIIRPYGDIGPYSRVLTQQYHRSSPLKALRERYPEARIDFRDGRYVSDAAALAGLADVVIVFATQWMSEGFDLPDLSLPDGQDALIAAVAKANPRTIVVLETGGPVAMPWLDESAAVLQAWYPGIRGGEAIAEVISGDAYPGGRLPLTFPRSTQDLPRPEVPGALELGLDFTGSEPSPGYELVADYDVEGAEIGYRWLARKQADALFPFGFGLGYTAFAFEGFTLERDRASVRVSNTGERPGAAVPQLYLLSRDGQPMRRLVGFAKA